MTEFGKMMPSTAFLVTMGTLLILWFGGGMAIRGELTVGELVAFNSYLLMLSAPVQQLAWLVNLAGEAVAGVQRTFGILDIVPEIRTPEGAIVLPAISGQVEFRHVSFRYAGQPADTLHDVSFAIKPGEKHKVVTGIPGKTGIVYTLDRQTGEFLWARPTVMQNVVSKIDGATGKVTVNPDVLFTAKGQTRMVCPGSNGGKNWPAGAYNPRTNVMFYPLQNVCMNAKTTTDKRDPSLVYGLNMPAILAPGTVQGNIKTPRLIVEEGVLFDGKCEMASERKASEQKVVSLTDR